MEIKDLDDYFLKMETCEDACELVYKILEEKKEGISISQLYTELFQIGRWEGEECKRINSMLEQHDNYEMYNGQKVHATRIGTPHAIELYSLDKQKKFCDVVLKENENNIEFALMISLVELEHQMRARETGAKFVQDCFIPLWRTATENEFSEEYKAILRVMKDHSEEFSKEQKATLERIKQVEKENPYRLYPK